jgi:energy-coupling factor transporter ATP-binding protein EcfA2
VLDTNAPPLGRDHCVFCAELGTRLSAGSHLILYGPRGSGKSTLIEALRNHYQAIGTPCGVAPQTSGLPDIIAALSQAYPDTMIDGIGKRAARVRLRLAADHVSGVLLLDHATAMTTAMLGYLRRLRGGIAGALLVADIDTTHERERMRAWRAGALSIRMPRTPNRELLPLLTAAIRSRNQPAIPVEPRSMRQILRAARGRIGWLHESIRRLQSADYWREDRLHAAVLCTDTEIAMRESRRGPRMCRFKVA